MCTTILDDLAAWQRLLQRHCGVLSGVKSGARIGLVHREGAASDGGQMIVWVRGDQGLHAVREPFRGFRAGEVDVIFVVDDDTMLQLFRDDQPDPIRALRLGIRKGNTLLYFLRNKRELRAKGYEDFVELVGVPLGGCL